MPGSGGVSGSVPGSTGGLQGKYLSGGQLYELIKEQGSISNADAKTLAAIGLAESSGDPHAKNSYVENGVTYHVVGLWQISDVHKNLANLPGGLENPDTNARAAYILYKAKAGGGPFNAWTTYKNGTYKEHLSQVNTSDPLKGIVDTVYNPLGTVDKALASISDPVSGAVNSVLSFLKTGTLEVGVGLAGAALIVGGVAILASRSKVGADVVHRAAGAAKLAVL